MARKAAKAIDDKTVAALVVKPKRGEYLLPVMTVKMQLPPVLVVDMMHRTGKPPTAEFVHGLAHPPKRARGRPKRSTSDRARERARYVAYEVARLEALNIPPELAKKAVASVFGMEVRAIETARKNHRIEAQANLAAYVRELVRLGKVSQ